MDTDGDSRQICSNILMTIIKTLLMINSIIYNTDLYIIGNRKMYNLIQNDLFEEGYYIKNIKNCIYIIYPILYGERK